MLMALPLNISNAFGDYIALQFIPVNTILRLRFVARVILFTLDPSIIGINHSLLKI